MLKRQHESPDFRPSAEKVGLRTTRMLTLEVLLDKFKQTEQEIVEVSGPLLMAIADSLAKALGHSNFQAESGFIDH